jgi:hypothetical protein
MIAARQHNNLLSQLRLKRDTTMLRLAVTIPAKANQVGQMVSLFVVIVFALDIAEVSE